MASDEDIQCARLGKVTPHNAPITLTHYDPGWPVLYAREAVRIRATLGDRAHAKHLEALIPAAQRAVHTATPATN